MSYDLVELKDSSLIAVPKAKIENIASLHRLLETSALTACVVMKCVQALQISTSATVLRYDGKCITVACECIFTSNNRCSDRKPTPFVMADIWT
jgi:hypothetical protein